MNQNETVPDGIAAGMPSAQSNVHRSAPSASLQSSDAGYANHGQSLPTIIDGNPNGAPPFARGMIPPDHHCVQQHGSLQRPQASFISDQAPIVAGSTPLPAAQGTDSFEKVNDLEGRLRGLILGNSQIAQDKTGTQQAIRSQESSPYHKGPAKPQNQSRRHQSIPTGQSTSDAQHQMPRPQSSPSKKRPNQAQRRQMQTKPDLPAMTSPPKAYSGPTAQNRSTSGGRGGHSIGPRPERATAESQRAQQWRGFAQGHPVEQPQETQQTQQYQRPQVGGPPGFHPPQSYHGNYARPPPTHHQLYEPTPFGHGPHAQQSAPRYQQNISESIAQARYLEELATTAVPSAEIDPAELQEKDEFRKTLEEICKDAITRYELGKEGQSFDSNSVTLECFGSLSSGFATKSSDMDLALLSPNSKPEPSTTASAIPRILEKHFLDRGYGARLLTRTRVPIIKLCESPTEELLTALREERTKWEEQGDEPEPEVEQQDNSPDDPTDNITGEGSATPRKDSNGDSFINSELVGFSQKPQESLWQYCRRARRVLESIGGRDYMMPRHRKLEFEEGQLLNSMSKAFVVGLHDHKLKERLLSYKSVAFEAGFRSLNGIWVQTEGERMVMGWESRTISEASEEKEAQGQMVVDEWHQLQDKDSTDILAFNEALHKLWEKIKLYPSAKLAILAQGPDESSRSYNVRTTAILRELGGRDLTDDPPLSSREASVFEAVVAKFIEGIRGTAEKELVREFCSSRENISLADMAAQFIAESQMYHYEHPSRSTHYTDDEKSVIRTYASLIRQHGASAHLPELATAHQQLNQLADPTSYQRERTGDKLDFPKTGVGIQCDINFSNQLALHNTALLRCYSLCDPRVRPMVLFVKAWAKKRQINSPYNGTLSSYGYVLMVLHFLVNVAQPPVVPNLQLAWRPPHLSPNKDNTREPPTTLQGYDIRFWRSEPEIRHLASQGHLTQNHSPLGFLIRDFYAYYAAQGPLIPSRGFNWSTDVLSLRTKGGLLSKHAKGWTAAKMTTMADAGGKTREVRHRYLLAVEDPFEVDHNVARTVTHHGVVAIRDELRRAWRILGNVGRSGNVGGEGGIFDDLNATSATPISSVAPTTAATADAPASTSAADASSASSLVSPTKVHEDQTQLRSKADTQTKAAGPLDQSSLQKQGQEAQPTPATDQIQSIKTSRKDL